LFARTNVLTGLLFGLVLLSCRAFGAEVVDDLSADSQKALSELEQRPRNPVAAKGKSRVSTPLPMPYSPAIRPDGRHVVAIDIGHTVALHGATSARGEGEFHFNQRIARQLFQRLEKSAVIAPYLINPEGGRIGLIDRPRLAAAKGAELLVSIHHDSANDRYLETWQPEGASRSQKFSDRFSGYGVFVSKKNREAERSLQFALLLGESMKSQGFRFSPHHAEAIKGESRVILDPERGVYQYDDLIVLKHSPMPALLLECGVIINRTEEAELKKPEVQGRIVEALAAAIERGFGNARVR
jgi:N-acetylmuramoyl-L-alanine amidase